MTSDGDERAPRRRGGQATGGRMLTPRGERTRASLVDAAAEVFEETPFAEVRLSDITARAQVAAGTFYTYFDSKEQIFREVAQAVLEEMADAARVDVHELANDPVRAFSNATRRYFEVCLEHAGVARSMEHLAVADDDVRRRRRSTVTVGVKRVERGIRDLQERGICDGDIDSRDMAVVLHTMTVRMAYDHLLLADDGPSTRQDVDRLVAVVTQVWARTLGLDGR